MAADLLVSEIVQAYGAYYLNSGQNLNNIIKILTQGSVTPTHMTPIKTDNDVYRMASFDIGPIVQPFKNRGPRPTRESSIPKRSGNAG